MNELQDDIDRELVIALQQDARLPQSALGDRVGLSAAAVNRRLRRLMTAGVITGAAIQVAPERVGRPVTVIAQIALESEQPELLDRVRAALVDCAQVQQCYYVAGEWDFVLVLIVTDMAEYTQLTRDLFFADSNVRRFSTQVVMDRAKVSLAVTPAPLGRSAV
ncbi:transcriptional regulator, AsnC family [Microbacterium sp. cf046]|uniref:Lrp/AsnC family transcriptional regulator n=1 Tax=Microbacterium sp. cf046 TaxID=1761803 RepID=UPI0008F090B8|nr:Lrp/AsnC family transcriptional regulator [Microbacterium sp. cf046]SFS15631.1 transcriptional regulator, AsnC family [Microbacterium sp. cf046]